MSILESKVPQGAPVPEKWSKHKAEIKVVSPANKRKLDVVIVGTGLAGASAAAALGELGYNVRIFCISDSPRRAHSIAAQGGINAAKNYQNDNDSVYRLFYDTIKGGDYRAREANVYRLAEVSNLIIDQVCGAGGALCAGLRGIARQPQLRGGSSEPDLLCPGADGAAVALGGLCRPEPADPKGDGQKL